VAALMLLVMAMVVGVKYFGLDAMPAPAGHAADYSNTRELGMQLYTTYVYPFEIASVILLVAIIAAIALTLRRRPGTRFQRQEEQVLVKRDDRVRMVKMGAEERK
jgi:NADH-quinone oxidoreductase subunit J